MASSYINTNLLGDVEVRITLSDTSVLMSGSVNDGTEVAGLQNKCTYDIKDMNFYIETASIQSNILDQAIEQKLKQGVPINIPFENVFSFQQTSNGSSFNQRFSVSSQSINKIIAITQLVADVQQTGDQKRYFNGVPQALRRNSSGATQCQFSINNQYSSNYLINSELNAGFDFLQAPGGTIDAPVFTAANIKNYQATSGLVETVAALDIPDYDYESTHHKLTSTT